MTTTNYFPRGLKAEELTSEPSWFTGPKFLHPDEAEWPTDFMKTPKEPSDDDPDFKPAKSTMVICKGENENVLLSKVTVVNVVINPEKYSKWRRLLRHRRYYVLYAISCQYYQELN
ncbi:uncharacterized protein LOC143225128 [Tachypleus tridentatus]|uniref:uncharacterized protein LOC143225128 n=1 Tax=Tachypleus tridentatus TaxID=6853 RepID=UPI003FD0F3CD